MSGGRNGDVEVADGAGMVRSDGMGHVSRQGGHWMCATASPGCGLCHEYVG